MYRPLSQLNKQLHRRQTISHPHSNNPATRRNFNRNHFIVHISSSQDTKPDRGSGGIFPGSSDQAFILTKCTLRYLSDVNQGDG